MRYAWKIDRDLLYEQAEAVAFGRRISDRNDKGTVGPSHAAADLIDRLSAGDGFPFRMYDDDDELYYEGRTVSTGAGFGGEEFFGPLEDFGRGNAGCTRIDYLMAGRWVTL